jgi:hypothetical protein
MKADKILRKQIKGIKDDNVHSIDMEGKMPLGEGSHSRKKKEETESLVLLTLSSLIQLPTKKKRNGQENEILGEKSRET